VSDFICFGHRGACGYEPENTLSSFEKAIALGCPWIELDVYFVGGELLVIHDDSLERTTSGKGEVMDSGLYYLRSLDAGKAQQIPTLQEVAELVDGRCGINIELKGPDTAIPASIFAAALCRGYWQEEQFLFSSFNHKELIQADPAFKRGALFHKKTDYLDRAEKLGAYSINLSRKLVSRKLVEECHEHNFKVFVYTVNETKEIQQMIDMNVDGVFCDYPDRVFDILNPAN
jgi:glycerophosphoryl diester phosphodiesterase